MLVDMDLSYGEGMMEAGPVTKAEWITPGEAEKLLEKNVGNRKIRIGVVLKYAKDMLDDKWQFTHQGIAIGSNGNIIDGQHRLSAIVYSGVPIRMLVTRGVECNSALGQIIDQGALRGVHEVLGMSSHQVAVIRCFSGFIYGFKKKAMSAPQVEKFYNDIPDLREMADLHNSNRSFVKGVFFPTTCAIAIMAGQDKDKCISAWERIQKSDFDNMSTNEKAYYKYHATHGSASNSLEDRRRDAERAVSLFDPSKRGIMKTSINAKLFGKYVERCKNHLIRSGFQY